MPKLILAGDEKLLESFKNLEVDIIFQTIHPADLHRALYQGGFDEVYLGFAPETSLKVLEQIQFVQNVGVVFYSVEDYRRYAKDVYRLSGVPYLLENLIARFKPKPKTEVVYSELPVSPYIEQDLNAREAKTLPPQYAEQKIFAVFSSKGGVGKTTFSAYFAAHASLLDKRTVAIDTDVTKIGADLGRRFNFFVSRDGKGFHNILDFLDFPPEQYYRWDLVKQRLSHVPQFPNLHLVLNPVTVTDIAYDYELLEKVVSILRYHFPVVLLDLAPGPSNLNFNVFKNIVDKIFFIVTPDPVVIDGAKAFIQEALRFGIEPQKFHLLINMSQKNVPMTKIAGHVGLPLRGSDSILPYETNFREKITNYATIDPKVIQSTAFGRTVEKIVKMNLGYSITSNEENKKRGIFQSLFRR